MPDPRMTIAPSSGQHNVPGAPGSIPPPSSGGVPSYPSGGATLGQPMYPWLMPYQGLFSAPLTDTQHQTLAQMMKLYGGGGAAGGSSSFGGVGASGYPLGGHSVNAGPPNMDYVNQIKDASQILKDYQDKQALAQIGSASAAGGNALSGARLSATQDYLRNSGASFDQMISNLMNENWNNQLNRQNALNLANIQAGPAYASVSERGREANQANQLAGLGMLWGAGSQEQQAAQGQIQGQYQDWLRQIGALNQAYNYPNNLGLGILGAGYPGSNYPQYGPSQAAGWASLLGLLGGGGGGGLVGGLGNLIGGIGDLFGGGGGSSSNYANPYGDMSGYTGGSVYPSPAGPDYSNWSYDFQDPYLWNYYAGGGT